MTIFLLRREPFGIGLVYVLFALAWLSDASAYFIGSFFGRTRGIVKVSPGKSLEGYAASFVVTLGAAAALPALFPRGLPFGRVDSLVVGCIVAVLAPVGDLAESALKRKAGRKDSSQLFPAFGGVLDIFDSVFMCAPFYYMAVKLLV